MESLACLMAGLAPSQAARLLERCSLQQADHVLVKVSLNNTDSSCQGQL